MEASQQVRAGLRAAVSAGSGLKAAPLERLCQACVEYLDVDGAAVSLMLEGVPSSTIGASGEMSRRLDELQFTFGEGPCVDAVRSSTPILVDDLTGASGRWPAFADAALDAGISAVFALPVSIMVRPAGALDLFRRRRGGLSVDMLAGGLEAADLAATSLSELLAVDLDWAAVAEGNDEGFELAASERVEVYQATGMIMGQLDIDAAEAAARLRAYAFAQGQTASEVAWNIVERRLVLPEDV